MTDAMTGFWPSPDGRLPPDEPACGFRGEKCDYTILIVLLSVLAIMVISVALGYLIYWKWFVSVMLQNRL